MVKDTDEKIERVYDYVNDEIREAKTDIKEAMREGFGRVEGAIATVGKQTNETNIELIKVRAQLEHVAKSKDLEKRMGEVKAYSIDVMKKHVEAKHGSRIPAPTNGVNKRQAALLAGGGVVGTGGIIYILIELIKWIKALH